MAEFYVKKDAQPDENGKYSDFIGVADDFFIEPDGGIFNGVFMNDLPDPGDEDYARSVYEESRSIIDEYVISYYEDGKEISMEELDFTSDNYEGEGTEPIEREILSIQALCEDESGDAAEGMRLFRMGDIGEYEAEWRRKEGAESIEIPDGARKVYSGSYRDCTALKSVGIPASVAEIGNYAFSGCTSLAEIRFAGTKKQWNAIQKGEGWNEGAPAGKVICADGTAEVPQFRIEDGKLERYLGAASSVTIPEGVTEIDYDAFRGCTSLSAVNIPEGVTEIGDNAFYGCTSLASINIPEGVTEIGGYAFAGCTALASVSIPGSVKEIDYCAFQGCTSLTSIVIPEGVTKIDYDAFKGCESLASASIPEGVTKIGSNVFKGCTALKEVCFGGTKAQWFMTHGCRYWFINLVAHCSDGDIQILAEDGSASIPDGVTAIGEKAFYGHTSLASVTIPEGVTEIGGSAFYGCTSLASVSIPKGVTEIGKYTFWKCTSLASVVIPASVTKIGGAFGGCTSLAEVRYGGTKAQWLFQPAGFRNGISETVTVHCSDGDAAALSKDLTEIVIPAGVTAIGSSAFKGCKSLASVVIPEGVTKIGNGAFEDCTSLTSLSIPEGVTEIGGSAFSGCTSLASINIPEGVTEIGFYTFSGCPSLTSVVIPGSVTEIGEKAFEECKSLTEIHYAGTKAQWKAVEKGKNWKHNVPAKDALVRKE